MCSQLVLNHEVQCFPFRLVEGCVETLVVDGIKDVFTDFCELTAV